jgi:hypothetical protein
VTGSPDVNGAEQTGGNGPGRVRGALAKLAKRGQADRTDAQDPRLVLWQLEEFTSRVVKRHGSGSMEAARARMELSLQLARMGKWDAALLLREDSFATFCRTRGEDDEETLQTELSLAVALAHAGRRSEAEGHLRHAASTSLRALGPDHEATHRAQDRLDEFVRGQPDGAEGEVS